MAKFSDVPFAMQKGDAGLTQNGSEVLRNMFAEITVSGRAKIVRKQRACLRAKYAITGEKRCIEKFNGLHYCVIGPTFYQFDGTTLTSLGTLDTGSGRCTMVCNDNAEIMISDQVKLYYWNGTALGYVDNPAAFTPGNLSYLNGYGIVNSIGSDQFYITGADDFSSIDALDFATAESNPDPLQTTFTDHNDIWLPGTTTIEIWQDTGGQDFPFQASTFAKIERGTLSGLSFAADDNTVIFLGDDGVVYRADGYRPLRISTHPVEEALRKCSAANLAQAYAVIYFHGGHKFYTLTVPGELTVQYNFATQLWNEAHTYGYPDWHVVGSAGHYSDYVLTDNGIAELTPDVNQDEGGVVVRLARSAPGWADGNNIAMRALQIDCEVGEVADPTLEPTVMMRVARDAVSFGNTRTRSLGTQGNYRKRVVFRGLGYGRKPVIELSASDDFNFAVMGTLLNAKTLNS